MRDKLQCVPMLGLLLSLLLLCSCATEHPSRSRLPGPLAIHMEAGDAGPLLVMIGLQSGEKLPFLLDTGAPVTCLDTSLEPRLGKRISTVTARNFGVEHEAGVYEAPQLYLGRTPLTMTGTNVITWDFKRGPSKGPHPYVGILGMHVLLNYCIQLDFAAHRMRFLDAASTDRSAWGTPFALADVGDGCVAIRENLVGAQGPGSIIDTGYRGDGFLTPELFQRWTNHATLAADGETRDPQARLGGETYPDVIYLNPESLSLGDPPRPFNGIGLYFLARHCVTFDFPNHTMYLKRTRVGPVVDDAFRKAANEAGRLLDRLKRNGQLPGWSKKDEFANGAETVQLRAPNCVSFDQVRKKGDSSVYHYEFRRPSQDMPWRLQRAWRTDQNGHTVEQYPTFDSKGAESEPMQGQ